MPIRRLPPLVVNQIAAGEVIERPASVVKELIENAIDAGATRIAVAIEEGGKALVRVADDGRGIAADELPLALAPHATSKIERAEDLDGIGTMGFRGEALASIASVSRISVASRAAGSEGAFEIAGEGADVVEPRPVAGAPGTTVTVRSLFFNTPARRRFMKADRTEAGRVAEIVRTLSLAYPAIAFTLESDGQSKLELPVAPGPRERALAVLGPELADELLEMSVDDRGVALWGLVGTPAIARPTAKHQRVFLNGRAIVDRSITHALREAYRGLIEPSRSPTVVLFIEMDPAAVDVNVHPTKAEVRFRDAGLMHGVVLGAVRERLREADLTPMLDVSGRAAPMFSSGWTAHVRGAGAGAGGGGGGAVGGGAAGAGAAGAGAIVESLRGLNVREKGFVYSEMKAALAREAPEMLEREVAGAGVDGEVGVGGGAGVAPDPTLPAARSVQGALQVHSSYIVTEDEQGVLIIDQHALHERVMFEKLKQRVDGGALEAQRLLVPATVTVDAGQTEALERLQPLLARLGIEAELMGPRTVAIHAFTSLLFERGVEPEPFVRDLLARTASDAIDPNAEVALHEVLDMMACKAAIKAGDSLEPAEIDELLRYRTSVERSSNCPHGRPTTIRLSLRDLERQFGRR